MAGSSSAPLGNGRLRTAVTDHSLARVLPEPGDGSTWSLPHLSRAVEPTTYLQTVMQSHFDRDYGPPVGLIVNPTSHSAPRTDVTSIDHLTRFPKADGQTLRSSELEYLPQQYYDPTALDISDSSGTTDQISRCRAATPS